MVNEVILEGLRHAVMRGESVRQAMSTFLNAGYNKEEIDEAVRMLEGQQPMPVQIQPQVSQPVQQNIIPPVQRIPPQIPIQPLPQVQQIPIQVSQPVSPIPVKPLQTTQAIPQTLGMPLRAKLTIVVMILIFLFLLASLVSFFLFKNSIINFFNAV